MKNQIVIKQLNFVRIFDIYLSSIVIDVGSYIILYMSKSAKFA